MGNISVSLPSDGTTADVADYNTPITTIVNAINGNLDNSNLVSGAAIATDKLADDAVTTAKILDDNVTAPKIVGIDKSNLTTDSNPYKFRAYRAGAATVSNGSYGKVAFETETYDTNNNFDSATNNRYVAPVAGFYQFNWRVSHNNAGAHRIVSVLFKNGAALSRGSDITAPFAGSSGSDLVQLAASDYVEIFALTQTAALGFDPGADIMYFSGFLVCRT